MAETRSAVPSQSPGTVTGLGIGLPSIATTVNVCPGNARLRISVALPFSTWKSTRSPGFTATQHPSVDRGGTVPDLESMRHAFGQRVLHGVLAGIFQFLYRGCGQQKVHRHVTAAAVHRFEFLQRQENLAIVVAGVVLRFDIYRTDQACVLSRAQVC